MSAAARALQTNTATVSRHIKRLNEQYAYPLFARDGAEWIATDFGRQFIRIAEKVEAEMTIASAEASTGPTEGTLRVSCPIRLIQSSLSMTWQTFMRDHPHVNLHVSYFSSSLAFGETDLRITHARPDEGRVIRKKLGNVVYQAYCDVAFRDTLSGWVELLEDKDDVLDQSILRDRFDAPARLAVHGLNLARDSLRDLPFVAYLPTSFAHRDKQLYELTDYPPIVREYWASYHYSRKNDPLIKTLMDWL